MTRQSIRLLAAAMLLLAAAFAPAQSRGPVRKTPRPAAQSSSSAPSAPPASPAPADRSWMVTIESPAEGSHLKAPSVAVRVRAGDAVLNLSVNGVSASRDANGVFVASPVALPEGAVTLTATATDRAGHSMTSVVHVTADRTPPRVTVFAGGSALSSGAALKRGTRLVVEATDLAPVDLKATLNGQPFVSGTELRQEGNYTLEVDAADRAGNRTRRSLFFHVQTRAPELVRLSPASGTVLAGATVTVSGECEDAETVTVGGIAASVYGRRFVATEIPLALGNNNIDIVARDAAGNQSRSSLKLTRDSAAPRLTIPAASGSVTRDASIVVRGTVEDQNLAEVSVNGVHATLLPLPPGDKVSEASAKEKGRSEGRINATRFQARVPLVEGPNRLTIVARDAAGNRSEKLLDAIRSTQKDEKATASPAIAVDAATPQLVSFDPADGSRELPTALVPRLRFSKPIDRASVTDSAVRLVSEPEGEAVAATLFVDGKEIALLPRAALTEKTTYRLEVSGSLADTGGNRLRDGRIVRFTTGRASAPPTPQVDSFPAATCAASVVVSGKADPGSRIRVEGGAELATSVADDAGRFSIPVPLASETVQALSVVAVDSANRSSQPVVRPVRRDCTPPRVEKVKLEPTGLEIFFSEPIDPKSLAADGAVVFTRRPEGVTPAPRMELDATGRIARFEESEALREGRTSVTIGRGVTDLAGNSLPAPFVTLAGAAALAAGQAGLSGQVFDDRIGRPIPGAVVTVVAVNGVAPTPPAPSTTTATDGSFSLVVPTGEIVLRASQSGYAAALRISTVAAGDSITVFDVRLTPETIVTAAANGSAAVTDAELSLTLPASSVAAGSTVRAASVSPQGIAALQPLGWAPAAALSLEVGAASVDPTTSVAFPAPASASWDNRWGYPAGTSLLLARFDVPTRRYVSLGPATLGPGATKVNASIPSTGAFVVFVADPAPTAPPQPSIGQPLAGVATPATDPIVSATVTSTPTDVLPTQTADILGKLTLSSAVPSGYPVEVLVSETLTLLNNQQVQVPSFLEDLTVLRDGTGQTIVPFRVRPSSTAAQVALSVGYENLTVRHYAANLTQGNLIGTGGGTVTGPAGFTLVIPAAALSQTVPVSLTQVVASDVPVAVPAGYHLVAAVQLALGGQTLSQPAALRWASTTDPTGSGLIWAEVASINGITRPRFINPGRYDSVNKFVETTPAAVHNLPVPGVLAGDIYLLLGANQSMSYVKGKVFDVGGVTPVASAIVTQDNTTLMAMTDGTGAWALSIPAAGGIVRSSRLDTGNVGQATVPSQAAGAVATKDIVLTVTAPYVVSVAPAVASPLPLDLPVVFTLSEPLNPATVGANAVTALLGTTPVPGTARLSITGTQITFTPTGSWPDKASVKFTLSSLVTDRQGYQLVDQTTKVVADYVVTYNTIDPTPPSDVNPLLIYMTVPVGSPPTVTITGTAGAACSACTVIAVNDTTTVTSSTTALSDGSFTMTLAATTTDRVYVLIRRTTGGEIRVDPGPYREDGGRVAYLGPRASDYITRDGIRVTVDQGAFSLPVTLRVSPIAQADLPAPLPTQSTFIAGISFDPGDVIAGRPIDLAVAAPNGVTGGQFLVARAVEVAGETKWMVVDTARYDSGSITTRPSGATGFGMHTAGESVKLLGTNVVVDCPELNNPGGSKDILDRVIRKSNLIILGVQQQLAFLASAVISPNAAVSLVFSAQYQTLQEFLPYVWVAKEAKQQCYFALPVPLNVPMTIVGRDATTGLMIFQGSVAAVTDPTNITQIPPGSFTSNLPAPRLESGSPLIAYTFVPGPTTVGQDAPLFGNVTYSLLLGGGPPATWTLTVKGLASSVESLADLTLTDNARTLTPGAATAVADGSFNIAIGSVTLGDDFTFLAGTTRLDPLASIHLVFTQEMDLGSINKIQLNAGVLPFDVVTDPGNRGFWLTPRQPFTRGSIVTLRIPKGKVPQDLSVKLSSQSANLIGPRDVKDVNAVYLRGALLLEVTGTAGNLTDPTSAKLNLYDASDPANLRACGSALALYDFARGVTMDDHDRVLVAMGGGGTNGRVQVFRMTPATGTGLCGGRTLIGEGTNPGDLNLSWTETTVRTGAGNLGVLPEGFPRRLELFFRESRQQWVLDKDAAPSQFITNVQETPAGGPQAANSALVITGQVAFPDPADSTSVVNTPVTLVSLTTGASWTTYITNSDAQWGYFTINGTASSRDRLELRVNGAEVALVGTVGFGLQGVNVNRTVHLFGQDCRAGGATNDICDIDKRLLFSLGRLGDLSPALCRSTDLSGNCVDQVWRLDGLNDMALLQAPEAAPIGVLPGPADPPEATALAALTHFGLATFSVTGSGKDVRITQLGPGKPLPTFDSPPIFPNIFAIAASRGFPVHRSGKRQFCADSMWKIGPAEYRPSLAFLGSSEGIFVVDVTGAKAGAPGVYGEPSVVGLFKIAPGTSAVNLGLDPSRGLLYVGTDGSPGKVSVYDMTDPCTQDMAGHFAPDGDSRRIASVDIPGENPNGVFALDADTGMVFGAADSTTGGNGKAFALSLLGIPLRFVADTNRDGQWENVVEGCPLGVGNPKKPASPYCPDVVRVLANIFGGDITTGKEITVEASSASSTRVTLSELPAGFPRTKTYLTLRRQSDDPLDPGYNRYLSPPIVLIADPRARRDYDIASKPDEKDDTAAAASVDYACHNCLTDQSYASELAQWAPDTDGVTSTQPAKQAVEQWTGERLVVRLAWDSASETALKGRFTYLAGSDLQRATTAITTTRGDLVPSLKQSPAQNPSFFTTEAGVSIDTNSGAARTAWTDMAVKGRGLDFVLSRYYVSDVLHASPFGRNLDSPLFARVRDLPTGDVDFYPGDGSRHTFSFVPGANGQPGYFVSPKGVFLDLYRRDDLSFFLVYPDQTRLFFDTTGRLTKLIDRQTTTEDNSDGNALKFFYDGAGRLTAVTDPTNRQIVFAYNPDTAAQGSRGRISKVTDFDQRVVTYTYNPSGQLTDVDGPDPLSASSAKPHTNLTWNVGAGNLKTTLYKSGEMTTAKDGLSRQIFQIAYDAAKPANTQSVTYGGGTWQLAYAGATTTVTDPNSNARTYAHLAAGQAQTVTEPGGATTNFAYDPQGEGRLTILARPMGGLTTYDYSSGSSPSRLALGNVTRTIEYPRPGSPEATLGLTRTTTIDYGPEGPTSPNLPMTIVADGQTTSISRDSKGNPQTVGLPDGSSRGFAVDTRGLLTSSTDGAGITQTYTYFDSSAGPKEGYLKTRTGGTSTATYDVDARGNVVNVQDNEGRTTTYQVNKVDQVETESGAFSRANTTYNAAGQVLTRDTLTGTDAQSNPVYTRTTYNIDEVDRLKGRTESGGALSSVSSYTYDSAGNLKTVARTAAPTVTFGYDTRDRVTGVTVGSATVGYGYDNDGVRTSQTSPRPATTNFLIDGFGRRIGAIDPTQVKTLDIVDILGRPLETRVTKVSGSTETIYGWTVRQFDPLGRVKTEIRKLFTDPITVNPDGTIPTAGVQDVTTQTTYDGSGKVLTVTDPNGKLTRWEYVDPRGRLTKVTDPAGNTVEYTYDNSDNKLTEKLTEQGPAGPVVTTISYAYDGQNRLTKVTDPFLKDTLYQYDPRGNRTKTTDVELHVSTAVYDALGRKTSETDANSGTTQYEYDLVGHLTALVDANTNRTEFVYDAVNGRLQTETRKADNKVWTYGYDVEGNRTSVQDPNGTTATIAYDALNRVTGRTIGPKGAGVLGPNTVGFTLDPVGRIVSSSTSGDTAVVVENFKYDSLDRLLQEQQQIGSGPNRTVVNGYDLAGNLNALTYPSGLALTYDIDALNRVVAVKQAGTAIASYRDVGARPYDKSLANGITQAFNYDTGRRLTEVLSKKSATTVADVTYTLTPLGNKQTITRPDLAKKATYTFNANSQITQEALNLPIAGGTPERQTDYTIDKVLNYSQVVERVNGSITATKNQTINGRNQYSAFAGSTLTYDPSGNLTGGAGLSGTALAYDYENRFKKATLTNGTIVENIYDASGRKVREAVTISGTTKTTDYVLAGAQVLEQYTGTTLSARYVHGRGIDETVRAELDVNGDGTLETTTYPLQDELGNVERLTDATGATTERYDYQGYGKLRIFDTSGGSRAVSAFGWRWLFQGREYQSTLNAYDFRARELWPDLGRFGQEDPVGAVDSTNLYQGLRGAWPLFTDPSGLQLRPKPLNCPLGQTCMGRLEYEDVSVLRAPNPAPPARRVPFSARSFFVGTGKALLNLLISPGVALDPPVMRDPEGYLFAAANESESKGMMTMDLAVLAGMTVGPRFRGRQPAIAEREALSRDPLRRGYEVEDSLSGDRYTQGAGYQRARRGVSEVDFRDIYGIENIELKSLNPLSKSYVVQNTGKPSQFEAQITGYRQQLLDYNRLESRPINILDIQLTEKLTFEQDMVLRRFVIDSFENEGVLVEVTDYRTRNVLIAPPLPKH